MLGGYCCPDGYCCPKEVCGASFNSNVSSSPFSFNFVFHTVYAILSHLACILRLNCETMEEEEEEEEKEEEEEEEGCLFNKNDSML